MSRPITRAAKASRSEASRYHQAIAAGATDAAALCAILAARKQVKSSYQAASEDLRVEHCAQAADWCDTAARLLRGEPELEAEITVGEDLAWARDMAMSALWHSPDKYPPSMRADALLVTRASEWIRTLCYVLHAIHVPQQWSHPLDECLIGHRKAVRALEGLP